MVVAKSSSVGRIGTWRCPACLNRISGILRQTTAVSLTGAATELWMPDAEIQAAAQGISGAMVTEVCPGCMQIFQDLLGQWVCPEGEEGDLRGRPGHHDTALIGALLPVFGQGAHILLFQQPRDSFVLVGCLPLRFFDPDRLTYPGSRGQIPQRLWSLQQDYMQWRYADEPFHGT